MIAECGRLSHLFGRAFLMTLIGFRFLFSCAALAALAGTAQAAVYGKVDGGRVSVIYSDTQPMDSSYKLYSQSNRFIVHPGAWRNPRQRAQAQAQVMAANPEVVAAYAPTFSTRLYDSHIQSAASETNVDPALIRAVITVESGYNPSARSHAGAIGLMQLMPKTALKYGARDSRDPSQNIHAGARYLRDLKAMFGDDLRLVLAAYNAGEEAVMKYGRRIPPFAETVAYVPKVLGHYKALSRAPAVTATRGGE